MTNVAAITRWDIGFLIDIKFGISQNRYDFLRLGA